MQPRPGSRPGSAPAAGSSPPTARRGRHSRWMLPCCCWLQPPQEPLSAAPSLPLLLCFMSLAPLFSFKRVRGKGCWTEKWRGIPDRQKSRQRFPWLLFLSYLCNRACMTLAADCLGFSSCSFHIPATPGRNLHPCPLFDVEMLWVPLSSIVQVFPEGKSGRFADVFLSALSLQDLLAVFGDRQRWLFLWGNTYLQNLGQGKLLRECGYQQRLH